jgi:hypothetical protein
LVKVTFKPWEEVVIHLSIYYSLEDLTKVNSMGVRPGGLAPPLQWAEGVLLRFATLPPTDEVVRENLHGKIHWSVVEWALMPTYQNIIPIADINAKIPIINASANAVLREVAEALKQRMQAD